MLLIKLVILFPFNSYCWLFGTLMMTDLHPIFLLHIPTTATVGACVSLSAGQLWPGPWHGLDSSNNNALLVKLIKVYINGILNWLFR